MPADSRPAAFPRSSGAEVVAASLLASPAAAIVVAYALDRVGLTIVPSVILPLALLAAGGTFLILGRGAAPDTAGLAAFSAIVVCAFAWLLWLAWPAMLPLGGGPDLTHHLQLIDYIQHHWRLVHDPTLAAYLGEMIDYTPGSHVLAAMTGAWMKTDGLHVVHTVLALAVALKIGVVFLIARRLLLHGRMPFAITSALLLLVAPAYLLESFTRHFFFAQVVGELFAVGMWWALTMWDDQPSTTMMALFSLWGAAAFLTWPVWVGPPLVALLILGAIGRAQPRRERLTHMAVAIGPIAAVVLVYVAGRTGAVVIAGASGYVQGPSVSAVRWGLLVLVGLVIASVRSRARVALALVSGIGLQSAALFAVAHESAADTPYLALKMFYLAPYPIAVVASLTLAAAWTAVVPARRHHLAWIPLVLLAIVIIRPVAMAPRPRPIVSQGSYEAGQWARANLPPGCVDYFTADSNAAYWLHVAVLGNARATPRTREKETFEQKAAIVRWILPGGLPFAIAEDFSALPRDLRTSVDVILRFGLAAVIKRRGASSCAEEHAPLVSRGAATIGTSFFRWRFKAVRWDSA